MTEEQRRTVTSSALVIGAVLGIVGAFAPSPAVRALAWGTDGTLLVVGTAMLAVHHLRRGDEQLSAGFLVFMVGETLIVSGSGMELAASAPVFAAGAALWAAGLLLVSTSGAIPMFVRVTGTIAALLLGTSAVRSFGGAALDPLTQPLPYFAYPFLALTLIGWAWVHWRSRGPVVS